MTVTTTSNTDQYTADGVMSAYTFTFALLQATDLTVYINGTVTALAYTVAINANGVGGTVTFSPTVPTNGSVVILAREVDYTQTVSIPGNANLREATLETMVDRVVMQVQQVKEIVDRSLHFVIGSTINPELNKPNNNTIPFFNSTNIIWRTPNDIFNEMEGGGYGDVLGPVTSTANRPALFADGTGNLLKEAGYTIPTSIGTAGQVPLVKQDLSGLEFGTISGDSLFRARITLESGVFFSTANQTAKTTLYVTGTKVPLLIGGTTTFLSITAGEISKSLTGLSNTVPTDVFVRTNGGTEADTVELVAWTSTTARNVALTYQSIADYYVHSTNTGWTYVGTIMGSASGQCEYSTSFCGLWTFARSMRTDKFLLCSQGNDTWTYASATIREARNQSTLGSSRVGVVVGLAEDLAMFEARHMAITATGSAEAGTWIGINSTTVNSAQIRTPSHGAPAGGYVNIATAIYQGYLPIGYNIISWLENSIGASSLTFIGDNGSSYQSGMFGRVRC